MQSSIGVSIVCTVYNKAQWIEQTIKSLLAQETTFDVEIILIDDASTDGSQQIIKKFVDAHPDKINALYNPENIGIAKTWVLACQKAKGKYIARCDGDDFWLDPLKLQKQYELLEASPDSKWANSDFDIYDESGNFVSASGFETGVIPLADSYEKMLATRGFTMASTWLVERELMLEVNEELDLTTSDDTFNLQLDLFQRTKLSYLPEPLVAYVINKGSDSRPTDFKKLDQRFDKLLDVQKNYVKKYPQANFEEMVHLLLERNNHYEKELSKVPFRMSNIGKEQIKIYEKNRSDEFDESRCQVFPLNKKGEIKFSCSSEIQNLRVDLSEKPSYFKKVNLRHSMTQVPIPQIASNGFIYNEHYFFNGNDPQIHFDISDISDKIFVLDYEMFEMDDAQMSDYIVPNLVDQLKKLNKNYKHLEERYSAVINSRRWTIPTKIINFFRRTK